MALYIVLVVIAALLITLIYLALKKPANIAEIKTSGNPVELTNEVKNPTKGDKEIGMPEIAKHNGKGNCWVIIHDEVFDISSFTPEHPGGEIILTRCGQDGTECFETRPMGNQKPHSQSARNWKAEFYIGKLAK